MTQNSKIMFAYTYSSSIHPFLSVVLISSFCPKKTTFFTKTMQNTYIYAIRLKGFHCVFRNHGKKIVQFLLNRFASTSASCVHSLNLHSSYCAKQIFYLFYSFMQYLPIPMYKYIFKCVFVVIVAVVAIRYR